jgi:hypothetical protein
MRTLRRRAFLFSKSGSSALELTWHSYKYYAYERELALREIEALLIPCDVQTTESGVYIKDARTPEHARRLVYFSQICDDTGSAWTHQGLLERDKGCTSAKRQATRYSVHGLHEYKGKFNPQIAKSILNILSVHAGQRVLDPFCGSGTSLVECAHLGVRAVGTDINPLAVFLANAKLRALTIPADRVLREGKKCCRAAMRLRRYSKSEPERAAYLQSWFSEEYLNDVERLKTALKSADDDVRPVLLSIGSNLLRDYSLQEPQDLRIRRRKSAYPRISLFDAFEKALATFCGRLAETQGTLGVLQHEAHAIEADCRSNISQTVRSGLYDAVLTSPPYATALPYIDTQRLSLVWLGLLPPSRILALESELLGSREVRSTQRRVLAEMVATNENTLPSDVAHLCKELLRAIGPQDGFRRKAVPGLLYRYFSGMADVFASVREVTKKNGPFALVVGANHTTLGGTRFDIDTPRLLAQIASTHGWEHVETVPLQTYQRFGLHASNATTREALVILRAF